METLQTILKWLSGAALIAYQVLKLFPKSRLELQEILAALDDRLRSFLHSLREKPRLPLRGRQRFASWCAICGLYVPYSAWFYLFSLVAVLLGATTIRAPLGARLACMIAGMVALLTAAWLRRLAHKEWELLKAQ
jgi:hypothetical protein